MMAQTELEQGSRLFFRNADLNTYGFLNAREAFAAENPDITRRVLAVYEKGRRWALDHPAELRTILANAAKLTDAVAAKQLERTDLSNPVIGEVHREAILAAGVALQESGVIPGNIAVKDVVDSLIDARFARTLAQAAR
jgi:sulfonate transport system substrate-binding protein